MSDSIPQSGLLAIASGKGGTGKTTIATSLAVALARRGHRVQYLDCDVEEPNGHLFLRPVLERAEDVGIPVPVVDADRCTGCGKCADVCEYNAIAALRKAMVFPELCHGCGGCFQVCAEGAIREKSRPIGAIEEGRAGNVFFAHGRLNVGEALAPPLIRSVKRTRKADAIAILDAPPGTSCPVVATVRDADYVVLVTEPTPFGLNDLRLAVELMRRLRKGFGVVINRAGIGDGAVQSFCDAEGIPVLEHIPDNRRVAEAYSRGELPGPIEGFRQPLESLTSVILRRLREGAPA